MIYLVQYIQNSMLTCNYFERLLILKFFGLHFQDPMCILHLAFSTRVLHFQGLK